MKTTLFQNTEKNQIQEIVFPESVPVRLGFENDPIGYCHNIELKDNALLGDLKLDIDCQGLVPTIGVKVISYEGSKIIKCELQEVALCVMQANIKT